MSKSVFFCGIGGSGMYPLAVIARHLKFPVIGSDRSYDQGRTPHKFASLKQLGITLVPQDGSGISDEIGEMIVSTAVEDTIPDVKAARALGIPITHRAVYLARLFNHSNCRIAVAGTSGKSTVTGMIAFLLHHLGEKPMVMNGAVMRDFVSFESPHASALLGDAASLFVSEVDESDGSITHFTPDIAILTNIALDHKSMADLRILFTDFCAKARHVILNGDHPETRALAEIFPGKAILYSESDYPDLKLSVIGAHNRSNAAAALAAISALGLDVQDAYRIIPRFTGIKRRLETAGIADGVTVIDDFAHNPDKVRGSMAALRETPGRLILLYQPHGYGMLKLTGAEMGHAFAQGMGPDDRLFITQPLYLGGTVDKSVGPDVIAQHVPGTRIFQDRMSALPFLLQEAQSGDRIVIMGARDDSLSDFALQILEALGSRKHESP